MPVEVQDTTNKAEVSHSTVSPALNKQLAIAHETVERVQRVVRELGLVTNQFVYCLKTSRFYSLGTISQRAAIRFYHETQGGPGTIAHSLTIGNLFFTSAHLNELGIYMTKVFIRHHLAESLLQSFYCDDVNVLPVEIACN